MTPPGTLVERWRRFWFEEIPPHSYALLRILIGVVGALTIIGAWNPAFWRVSGIMAPSAAVHSWPWLTAHGLGDITGLTLRWTLLVGFVALALGIQTQILALAIFLGSAGMIWWNQAPYSGAQQLLCTVVEQHASGATTVALVGSISHTLYSVPPRVSGAGMLCNWTSKTRRLS